ncbi:hypothetical protein TWF694_004519 [Orbilia ellipsospora]|uniref:Heterokaryon incompatibility domain-containing protein n=1 Tax=Orbilia ellipsospora TaxID=2528407 RepID=A0AAV9WVC6_9PEZI
MQAKEDLRPLAMIVEQVWGRPKHKYFYTRAYFNWTNMVRMIDPRQEGFDEAKSKELDSKISETQITSFRLLREWWDGQIQEEKLSQDIAANILTAAKAALIADVDLRRYPAEIGETFRRIAKNEILAYNHPLEESSYHEALFNLWNAEFLISEGIEYIDLDVNLQTIRQWASIAACNQRVAWLSFEDILAGSLSFLPSEDQSIRKFLPPTPTSLAICPWLGLKNERATQKGFDGLPHYLWDVKLKRTVEVSSLTASGKRPRYIAVSHTWGRWRLRDEPAADVVGVPWKVPLNSRFDVRTMGQTLDSKIPGAEYIWIDIYCIPQETKDAEQIRIQASEIARQAEIFSNASDALIWFNDVKSWKGLEIAILWFAAIFIRQSRSRSSAGTPAIDRWIELFEQQANDNPTGFFEDYQYAGEPSLMLATLSGWFSSLWTLQEACLCPHILLAAQDWQLLAVGPKNLILTLDNLVAVVAGFRLHQEHLRTAMATTGELTRLFRNHEKLGLENIKHGLQDLLKRMNFLIPQEANRVPDMPRAAAELCFVLEQTELIQMLNFEPLTILSLANRRYCEHSRSQAIMSAIGTTKWFNQHIAEHGGGPAEENLMLGTFDFEFVKEIRHQLGVEFFKSIGSGFGVCPAEVFKRDTEQKLIEIKPIGSMLPFSSSKSRPKTQTQTNPLPHSKSHPSALEWGVLQDGTVEITSAAVFTSFIPDLAENQIPHTHLSQLTAKILIHSCEKGLIPKDASLSTFLGEYSPQSNIYAVILTHGNFSRHWTGLILQEIVAAEDYTFAETKGLFSSLQGDITSAKFLVRVGTWTLWDWKSTTEADLPPVSDVNWRVL